MLKTRIENNLFRRRSEIVFKRCDMRRGIVGNKATHARNNHAIMLIKKSAYVKTNLHETVFLFYKDNSTNVIYQVLLMSFARSSGVSIETPSLSVNSTDMR